MEAEISGISIASIIGFFVIVILLGWLLHFLFSRTKFYRNSIKGKALFTRLLYILTLLIVLYILLLIIFGVIIKLIL